MGESAGCENLHHLSLTHQQLLPGDEPSQTLGAGRCGQAALVCPVLCKPADFVDSLSYVDVKPFDLRSVVEVDQRAELLDECGLRGCPRGSDVDADTDDYSFLVFFIDVDHVDLGTTATAVDEMF